MKSIAYVIDSMFNSGGMERVLTVCANALVDTYSITIITAFQQGLPDYFKLNSQVRRHDLKIDDKTPVRRKKSEYKKLLSDYLIEHHFDLVISLGGLDLDFLHSIRDGSRKILWFHFVLDFNEQYLDHNASFTKRLKARLQTWKRIYYARKYKCVIALSKTEQSRWKKYVHNAIAIYNPITVDALQLSDLSAKAVISVGRLDYQKGYDYLIDAWQLVASRHPDWHLNIFGEGMQRNDLQEQIDSENLSKSITLCGRSIQIEKEYPNHSLFVMSSRAECMPLALLEASSCGLPLIAFDCPSGPGEIIENGENGFLIKDVGDIQAMADKICQLIEDDELRKQMGGKAKEMVGKFRIDSIREQWMDLFNAVVE